MMGQDSPFPLNNLPVVGRPRPLHLKACLSSIGFIYWLATLFFPGLHELSGLSSGPAFWIPPLLLPLLYFTEA